MDVDLDKEFLQDLKELKILITDKDLLDQHKRFVFSRECVKDMVLNKSLKITVHDDCLHLNLLVYTV